MRAALMSAAVLVLMATAPAASAQEGSEGIAFFVEGVFGMYEDEAPSPIDEMGLDAVWTPEMAALIRRDRTLAGEDLPYLDADPLCQCQDTDHLSVSHVRVERRDRRRAARVFFVNGGEAHETLVVMQGDPNSGWRIADVVQDDGSSLAEALAASNRQIEGGGRALGRD